MVVLLTLAGCEKTKAVRGTQKEPNAMGKLTVTSPAFEAGKPIPKQQAYKGEGENVSPPLAWSGAPAGTRAYAIICDDPDAPSPKNPRPEPWVHWVVYNIPADRASAPQGGDTGGTMGKNDFKETSWGGPMPPPGSGTHRYFFRVYALDARVDLPAGATKAQLVGAMQSHILAQGELYGTYERK